MKYQLTQHGWPVEHHKAPIPVGTIIDVDRPEWAFLADRIPPMNAVALDQAAYNKLAQHYEYWRILTASPEIVRHFDPKKGT